MLRPEEKDPVGLEKVDSRSIERSSNSIRTLIYGNAHRNAQTLGHHDRGHGGPLA